MINKPQIRYKPLDRQQLKQANCYQARRAMYLLLILLALIGVALYATSSNKQDDQQELLLSSSDKKSSVFQADTDADTQSQSGAMDTVLDGNSQEFNQQQSFIVMFKSDTPLETVKKTAEELKEKYQATITHMYESLLGFSYTISTSSSSSNGESVSESDDQIGIKLMHLLQSRSEVSSVEQDQVMSIN
ncbi:hypothetical protein MP228_010539 [Amoeboaphelidium protococcarum]|nr:hypothetical protein MP228_010539 [Amoeboaphelidium protococcarum]